MLHPDAINRVRTEDLNYTTRILYNLPYGVQIDWRTGQLFFRTFSSHHQGPFFAIRNLSRLQMLDTGGYHPTARQGLHFADIPGLNWMQVIHGGNIRNHIRYKPFPIIKIKSFIKKIWKSEELIDSCEYVQDDLIASRIRKEFNVDHFSIKIKIAFKEIFAGIVYL